MHRPPPIPHPLRVGDEFISASNNYSLTNLGVIFDSHMRMDKQISSIVSSSFCSLRDMYKARCCLITSETCEMMVRASITTQLDYCNALLYGLTNKQIKEYRTLQPGLLQIPGNMIILPQCLLNSIGFQWKNKLCSKI